MSSSNELDLNPNESFDAQRLSEEIESGEKEAPASNFDKDYQKAQEFAVGSHSVAEDEDDEAAAGNPKQFEEMAKKVNIPTENKK
jgi:uncharacterized protein YhfF